MENDLQQKLDELGWAEPTGGSYNSAVFALLEEIVRVLIKLASKVTD